VAAGGQPRPHRRAVARNGLRADVPAVPGRALPLRHRHG
jgi:hypothetical protein